MSDKKVDKIVMELRHFGMLYASYTKSLATFESFYKRGELDDVPIMKTMYFDDFNRREEVRKEFYEVLDELEKYYGLK